ncbi:hypothetical protein M2372_002229 [Chryseobacterium sp. BIGb0232]|nr:hypothetical protein [Chryseobacterium sp. BIGb0232]ROS17437.1 hypothetical protein EDF65_1807 [Chryseobacterium nakagawai]
MLLVTNKLSYVNNKENDKKIAYSCLVAPTVDFSNFFKRIFIANRKYI